jgi:indole-3-glycerol phosphate synthase
MTGTYLDKILHWHRERAAQDFRSVDDLISRASACASTRGFRTQLSSSHQLAVIAEIKRRSPSKGLLRDNLDPVWLAREYELGGASCLSVLTDTQHFSGSAEDLMSARNACGLPVLRKDFTVSVRDVCDARLMGADCVLLIAAALDDALLRDCLSVAHIVGIDALVEIHDEHELSRALDLGADLVGVNQRDLVTFQVDQDRAVRMGSLFPDDVVSVAESGVRGGDDALALRQAGYDAVLVGEMLVTSSEPSNAVQGLIVS